MQSVELFAGAGGLGMGVSRANFEPTTIVECDKWCCETINGNRDSGIEAVQRWPTVEPRNVKDVRYNSLEGKIELVTGGPPCQPFSLGGKHRAEADKRDMWAEAVRAVREIKPKAFIFENVKGLTRAKFASYLSYIELQLTYPDIEMASNESWEDHFRRLQREKTGLGHNGVAYNVIFDVLNAANYGVPQKRERVFFVGFRSELNVNWSFPKPTHSRDRLLWDKCRSDNYWERNKIAQLERNVSISEIRRAERMDSEPEEKPWKTVRETISDLPEPTVGGCKKYRNHRLQKGAKAYPGHTGSPLDEPAKTLKAGVHGVPGGENMLLRPDGSVRYFTVRESARLQTFPDEYELHGSWTEAMRQLGNAVPVELANIVAKSVREHLGDDDRKTIQPT